MARNKYGVAVYRQSQSRNGYKHLEMRVVLMSEDYGRQTEVCSFHWQTHQENGEWKPWYGCSVELRTSDGDMLNIANNLVKRLFEYSSFWSMTPEGLLEIVDSKRDLRVVTYDSRLSRWVYDEDVLPREWTTWRDIDNSVHAVAADEESARDAVEKRFREIAERRYFGMGKVDEWVAAGRPVAPVSTRWGPEVYTREQAVAV